MAIFKHETIASHIAEFAVSSAIPDRVLEASSIHLLDTIGVVLAASALQNRPQLEDFICGFGKGEATALGLPDAVSAPAAALWNGIFSHAIEADNTHLESVMHGSAIFVSAALAAAERSDVDGPDLLRALAIGWEVIARIGLAYPGDFFNRGFHATSVAAPLAAAVSVGVIGAFDRLQFTNAIGIAGSQCGGLFEFLSSGATSKWIHGGWPALAGLTAADLAACGMTGPETIFEGKHGFVQAYTGRHDNAASLKQAFHDLGSRWCTLEVATKKYPTCHFIQPFLECLEQILQSVQPDRLETIICRVPSKQVPYICEPWPDKLNPQSSYGAKWSLPYCLAAILVDGELTVGTFDAERPDPRCLSKALSIKYQAIEGGGGNSEIEAALEAFDKEGRCYRAEVKETLGSVTRPIPPSDLQQKFRAYSCQVLNGEQAEEVIKLSKQFISGGKVRDIGNTIRKSCVSSKFAI